MKIWKYIKTLFRKRSKDFKIENCVFEANKGDNFKSFGIALTPSPPGKAYMRR